MLKKIKKYFYVGIPIITIISFFIYNIIIKDNDNDQEENNERYVTVSKDDYIIEYSDFKKLDIDSRFYPNHKIANDMEKIKNAIIEIENVEGENDPVIFKTFSSSLEKISNVFQRDSKYKKICDYCQQTSNELARKYDRFLYSSYKNRCLLPLQEMLYKRETKESLKFNAYYDFSGNEFGIIGLEKRAFPARESKPEVSEDVFLGNELFFGRYYSVDEEIGGVIGTGRKALEIFQPYNFNFSHVPGKKIRVFITYRGTLMKRSGENLTEFEYQPSDGYNSFLIKKK